MITSSFENIKVAGVAAAVPTKRVCNADYGELFGVETVQKIIESTGVQESYHVHEKQTASDLACAAAQHLMEKQGIDPATIGVLIFVVAYADYFSPASAAIIQKRLGLSMDCIVYDMNLACSGVVYGLQTVSSLLQCSSATRALLLVGDTTSKTVSPQDKSRLLFGDAGAAMLIEKNVEVAPMHFGLKSDGDRFKSIIVPAGGFRNRGGEREIVEWGDGNHRSDYHLFMNGTDVFSFTMTDVPALFKEFMQHYQVMADEIDSLIMHQPNRFIITHLARKIKVPMEKVPLSLDRYGNTSGASIPVTLCDAFGGKPARELRLLLAGFGVGLSWGVADMVFDTGCTLPIIHTDDYFKDGGVSHD